MNRSERGEWLEEAVAEATQELEFAINAGHSERFLEILDFYSRFHKYSLANAMLILIQRPDATQCAGYKAWEKMGYHVREGEKAIWVRGPILKRIVDDVTGEMTKRLVGYIALAVFDVSQLVEQDVLPSDRYALEGDYDALYLNAKLAIGVTGVMVDEEPLPSGVHGMSMGGRIVISPDLSVGEKFLCLLHEFSHEVMHQGDKLEFTTEDQRELEAEAGSYLLAQLYGLTNPFSADYILHYGGCVEDFHDSLTRIHLAVRQIADLLHIEEESQAA